MDTAAIPKFHDFLRDERVNAVLILELLGPTLQTQRKLLGGTFSIRTTMMIGCQLVSFTAPKTKSIILIVYLFQLNIMEYIHSKGVIYNDIKPENFAVGYYSESNIYIFGKIEEIFF